ncbi:hypothetical protein BDV96DRAFT_672071 [Lophiotrema nucula]|uniref:RING-type domain-containing protein n=1 Tax=Lophiotrema nucula TaxID=690887 RepID=A0A6A5ZRN6_9PLEO|nr:hypothetical protein BDV96DRAFT_672071 [Lophiotrema nucula]
MSEQASVLPFPSLSEFIIHGLDSSVAADPQDTCAICQTTFSDDVADVVRLPCNHEFHRQCIERHVCGITFNRNKCCVCRVRLFHPKNILEPFEEAQRLASHYKHWDELCGSSSEFKANLYNGLLVIIDSIYFAQQECEPPNYLRILTDVDQCFPDIAKDYHDSDGIICRDHREKGAKWLHHAVLARLVVRLKVAGLSHTFECGAIVLLFHQYLTDLYGPNVMDTDLIDLSGDEENGDREEEEDDEDSDAEENDGGNGCSSNPNSDDETPEFDMVDVDDESKHVSHQGSEESDDEAQVSTDSVEPALEQQCSRSRCASGTNRSQTLIENELRRQLDVRVAEQSPAIREMQQSSEISAPQLRTLGRHTPRRMPSSAQAVQPVVSVSHQRDSDSDSSDAFGPPLPRIPRADMRQQYVAPTPANTSVGRGQARPPAQRRRLPWLPRTEKEDERGDLPERRLQPESEGSSFSGTNRRRGSPWQRNIGSSYFIEHVHGNFNNFGPRGS